FVHAAEMRGALRPFGVLSDWPAFAASWNDLEVDAYMADGGRYRRRRHAVFTVSRVQGIVRQPHQPHVQAIDYNPLNGGVARWFEPVEPAIAQGDSVRALLTFCESLFGSLSPSVAEWRVEMHQFRIEA